jgi:dTDP-4-amino-4,6-dideoxygalactose transaminase
VVRLSKCSVDNKEFDAIKNVLESEFFGTGPKTKEFEDNLRSFFGNTEYDLVCTNTGTSAIQLALQACKFEKKSEILVPTLTYVASYQAITAAGYRPISCDIDEESGLLSIDDAKQRISSNTKAIMLVHYNGYTGDLQGYYNFAKEHNLRVIEDAAHAFGSTYKDQLVGTTGDIACFSFDGIKNITCGEGGMVISKDKNAINNIRDLRLLGVVGDSNKREKRKRSWDYDVEEQGWRYHMSDIMASIGIEQLKKFDKKFKKKRKELHLYYRTQLKDCQNITLFETDIKNVVPHIFPIKVKSNKVDILKKELKRNNIPTGLHYKPNHLLSYFKVRYSLPNAEKLYKELVTLPFHVDLTIDEVKNICQIIKKVI